ncbi:hypothetical protein F4813DRAFT_400732 [Daldinia decipiens]|uniref:uncharacterized protein n=1 Tax=Daldinia decipiens TaxID=326647 RepID=UPI0020C3D9AF|nr:uncharacterized protein F4813DRAFT_400732 [Daldinia decipiens]KAI1660596.1 hypothetical protein F4813DRAFT_400732 [Daldinia decipiens]
MSFPVDQQLEFDFACFAPETTEAQNMSSVSTAASDIEELQKRNKELEQANAELIKLLKGFKNEMNDVKGGVESAQQELQSVRTHNARLQGELSSLTKRRRTALRTKNSDLELSQAAKIAELEEALAQANLRGFSVSRSDTSSASGAEDFSSFYRDSSTSSNSRQGSVESSRPRKRRSPGVESWDNSQDVLQFGTAPGNQQNALFVQALQGGQNQQSVPMASMAQFGGLAEQQSMSGYPQLYSNEQMGGQHNQLSWGTGYYSNPQPRQINGMPSCPKFPAPYQASQWSF